MPTSIFKIFGLVRDYKLRFAISQLAMLVAAICIVAYASLIKQLVDQGMVARNAEAALNVGIWMLVLTVAMGVAMAVAGSQAVFFSQGVAYYLRRELFTKIQRYSFENFDHRPTSALMVRLNADVVNVQNAVLYTILLGSLAPFLLLLTIAMAVINTPNLVWIVVVVIVAVIAVMAVLVPAIDRAYQKRQHALDALNNTFQENLTGMSVVKAFVRERHEMAKFEQRAQALRGPEYQAAWRVAFMAPLLTGLGQFAIVLAMWFGGENVLANAGLSVGEVSTFTQYMGLIITPLALLAQVMPLVMRGDVSAGRIIEAYLTEPTITDRDAAEPADREQARGRVVFDDVTFAFRRPDGTLDPPALKNINLTIEPGQQIGFLGATGAGKTALVNLIPRFYDVTEGAITIDGRDVRDIPLDDLRRIVGIALQETVLFKDELRANLKFGAPDAEDDLMFAAAKAADAYGFVSNLPDTWDAEVARRGYNFSGGQRQRLGIARALTPRPQVLILDDSTSALDVSTEGRVQAAIPEFMQGATVIYVAQRISALIDLDHIYLLEHGQIVAEGTHDELLASSELYREIYESQLGGGVTAGLDLEGTS
ncbi:ABC transporter ATP-binding protein [Mycolicibacterium palauense]|uniref:ABC transporter ATP-binding protein n=1 Tax=Mycolicibacterium palauense TaxID=2034511 RepID=UPI000BFECB06|nr:ABC transporter ATP-binding protein [Mycolicibacterium palauense]